MVYWPALWRTLFRMRQEYLAPVGANKVGGTGLPVAFSVDPLGGESPVGAVPVAHSGVVDQAQVAVVGHRVVLGVGPDVFLEDCLVVALRGS